MLALAEPDNVYMKLSALDHFAMDPPLYETARPFTEWVVEALNPSLSLCRCALDREGDMPPAWADLTVYVVRHGHRADSEPDYDGGWNTPLSETGLEQAEHLADFLADAALDALYSSCQLRALETTEPTHRETDVEWHVWPVFCEFSTRTWRELVDDDPESAPSVATWQTGPVDDEAFDDPHSDRHGHYYRLSELSETFPGVVLDQPFPYPDRWWEARASQTRGSGIARVELGAQALLQRHEAGDQIAVVCHNKSGDGLLSTLMGMPNRHQTLHHSLDHTGIARLDRRKEGGWVMRYANRVQHLPAELRT